MMLLPRCLTCPSVPALLIIESSQAHLTHVSTLAGPGIARIRPVMRGDQRRCWPSAPVSRCLSATGVGFLGHPVPAGELGLPYGRLTGRCRARTPAGFPRSTRVRYDRGGCPLNSGTAMLSRLTMGLQPAPAASQRPVLHPAGAIHRRLTITRHHQGFTCVHPSGLPLACNPRMEQGSLGFSFELHTPPLPATHVEVGTGLEHWPGTTLSTSSRSSDQVIHSISCDFVSHPTARGRSLPAGGPGPAGGPAGW